MNEVKLAPWQIEMPLYKVYIKRRGASLLEFKAQYISRCITDEMVIEHALDRYGQPGCKVVVVVMKNGGIWFEQTGKGAEVKRPEAEYSNSGNWQYESDREKGIEE